MLLLFPFPIFGSLGVESRLVVVSFVVFVFLTNVMSAVGVSASPLFARLLELFEMSLTEHAAVVQTQAQKPRDATVLLERILGKARGIGADAR